MESFVYTALPIRVVFGRGTIGQLAPRFGPSAARGRSSYRHLRSVVMPEAIAATLGPLAAGVYSEAAMHTPVEVTARAVELARALGADCTSRSVVAPPRAWERRSRLRPGSTRSSCRPPTRARR
jgi:maleylacetate reductase